MTSRPDLPAFAALLPWEVESSEVEKLEQSRNISACQMYSGGYSVIQEIERQRRYADLQPRIFSDSPERWEAIREFYRAMGEHWEPYPIDWTRLFTPIESQAWSAIRYYGLPMRPQYPIGRYFADFADPAKKLVIECDGRKWHDAKKDGVRDRDMLRLGWLVFRVSGADCNRILPDPHEIAEDFYSEYITECAAFERLRAWYRTTVDGVVALLAERYYVLARPRLVVDLEELGW